MPLPITKSWSSKNRAYHDEIAPRYDSIVRPVTLPSAVFDFKKHLSSITGFQKNASVRILDAGAGTGDFCADLINWGFPAGTVLAFDISTVMLRCASNNLPGINAINGDLLNLPFKDQSFDIINAKGVLHHIYDYEAGLAELIRCLKQNGCLRLQEPLARTNQRNSFMSDYMEAGLPYRKVKYYLRKQSLRITKDRLFLHFPTSTFLNHFTANNHIKNMIIRFLNPLCNVLGVGDIFLIIAMK